MEGFLYRMTFYWLVSCGQRWIWIRNPWIPHLSGRCWHLTPADDEVPVNPMLDYSENINIVKIIMGVPELSRFRLAYSRGPLSAGQIIIDKLRTEHNEGHRSFGVNISIFPDLVSEQCKQSVLFTKRRKVKHNKHHFLFFDFSAISRFESVFSFSWILNYLWLVWFEVKYRRKY